jgi:MoaA/NifB/PqqE/SkfB family radical SAM enzyme
MARYEIDRRKILRFPEEIAALREGRRPHVLNVEIDLTERCNLHCVTCDFPHHPRVDMTPEVEEQVLSCLDAWGTRAVVLTGGGEPTVHPEWREIATRWSSFALGMYTNGVALTEVPDVFGWVYVSLDAPDAETWAATKGAPASWFDRVVENIQAAAALTTVGVGFLVGPHNLARVEAMAALGSSLGAAYVDFRPLWPCPDNSWAEEGRSLLAKAESYPSVRVAWEKFEAAWDWDRPYHVCWASMFNRMIDASGVVYPCASTRWVAPLGHARDCPSPSRPVPVTDRCRTMCRGHGMNLTLDYVMASGPHDYFV